MAEPLRIGILGAAHIAPAALVEPARVVEGVEIAGVAARDPERARAFAAQHGIPRVAASYDALLADPGLDAIYNPLPAALHAHWTIRALRAGKHVLCEKPFASNAGEAEQMARAAEETGLVLVEAFHWRYHPLAERVLGIVRSGALGRLRRLAGEFTVGHLPPGDIRFDLSLGGGATMDLGCYPIHWLRTVAGTEPEVLRAEARQGPPGVDVYMSAELRFPDGVAGRITCAMEPGTRLWAALEVEGDTGRMRVVNPLAPHRGHAIEIEDAAGARSESVPGETTYVHQLRGFLARVRDGTPVPNPLSDAIANMRVIDAVYRAAGLSPRGVSRSAS